jgi:hypothetical protein
LEVLQAVQVVPQEVQVVQHPLVVPRGVRHQMLREAVPCLAGLVVVPVVHLVVQLLVAQVVQHPLQEPQVDLMVRAVDLQPMVRLVLHIEHRRERLVQDSAQVVVLLHRWQKHRLQFQVLREALPLLLHGQQ